MDLDDREVRLRSRFLFTMGWTALAVVLPGSLLGALLQALAAAGGAAPGLAATGHETVGMIAGYVAAGLVVVALVLRSYLAPCARASTTVRN
jgi:hypothetical protein